MKKYSTKRKKASSNSRFYLYMEFLPQFQMPRKDFTYNDDDVRRLKMVLQKAKDRYSYAKLVDRKTKTVLGIFSPEGSFSEWEWKNKQKNLSRSLLRGSMAFRPNTELRRRLNGQPPLLTIFSRDTNNEGKKGKDIAINNIREDVINGPFSNDFKMIYVFDGHTNKRVAEIDYEGNIFACEAFYNEIKQLKNERIFSLFKNRK